MTKLTLNPLPKKRPSSRPLALFASLLPAGLLLASLQATPSEAQLRSSGSTADLAPARGGTAGNGGSVVRCGEKVYLADFFELDLRPGLKGKITIPTSSAPVDEQALAALERLKSLDARVHELAMAEWNRLRNNWNWIDGEYEWTPTDDIGPYPLPRGCELKNAILYFQSGMKEVQRSLFEALEPTHEAGILAHEVVFKIIRDRSGEPSALPARRITALLFAERQDPELLGSLVARYMHDPESAFLVEERAIDFDLSTSSLRVRSAFRGLTGTGQICVGSRCERGDFPLSSVRPGMIHQLTAHIQFDGVVIGVWIGIPYRTRRLLGIFPANHRFRVHLSRFVQPEEASLVGGAIPGPGHAIFAILSDRMRPFLDGQLD